MDRFWILFKSSPNSCALFKKVISLSDTKHPPTPQKINQPQYILSATTPKEVTRSEKRRLVTAMRVQPDYITSKCPMKGRGQNRRPFVQCNTWSVHINVKFQEMQKRMISGTKARLLPSSCFQKESLSVPLSVPLSLLWCSYSSAASCKVQPRKRVHSSKSLQ